MKVLVQDLQTMSYLAPDGRWVVDRDNARDFFSLLPAYYFARDNTSREFQVVLYCPEDHFCASIIAGKGNAANPDHVNAEAVAVKVVKKCARRKRKAATGRPMHLVNGAFAPAWGFDEIRRFLN